MNLWEVNEDVKQFTLNTKFAQIAATLLGVICLRIYHAQILYKEPGEGGTPCYEAQYFWPIDTGKTVIM
jgi:hypothetical protein